MRIAHIIDYFQPELGYQETYLAEEQIKAGHEVRVFTSDRYFPFPNFESTYETKLGNRVKGTGEYVEKNIPVTRLPIKREMFARVWMIGLEKPLLDYEPDYILVHNVMSITAAKVSSINFPNDPVIVYDDHMSGLETENLRRKCMRIYYELFLKKKIVNSADSIVTVTKVGLNHLKEVFSIPENKLKFIPLGFNEKVFFKSTELRNQTREKFGFSKNDFVVIYSGKINEGKGISELIDALLELHKNYPEIKFLCIGNGKQFLEKRIQSELAGFVIKKDFVPPEKLCEFYNCADVGVWPNGITASHIEANACGLPIIVSNWPASSERVTEGNGIALESCKKDNIYEKIEMLIKKPALLEGMSVKALEISKELTWKSLSSQFLSITKN